MPPECPVYRWDINKLPQILVGDGDVVTAITNWGGSGRAAFLVSNGKWTVPGPYQLLVFSAP